MPRLSLRTALRRSTACGAVTVAVLTTAGAVVVGTAQTGDTAPVDRNGSSPPARALRLLADASPRMMQPPHPIPPARASRAKTRQPLDPRGIAKVLLARRGWRSEFSCLDALWTQESNWGVHAANPASSAYGIPQALPGDKMAKYGADWRTNPATQIKWGLSYIAGRYGSLCAAWSHARSNGYY